MRKSRIHAAGWLLLYPTLCLVHGLFLPCMAAQQQHISRKEASRQIQDFVERYEDKVAQASRSLVRKLDTARKEAQAQSVTALLAELQDCEDPSDRLHIAYHILRRSPLQAEAAAVYGEYGHELPFAPDGTRQLDIVIPVAATDRARQATERHIANNPASLAELVGRSLPSYQKKKRKIDDATFADMLTAARAMPRRLRDLRRMICQTICFYQPGHPGAIKLDRHAARQKRQWIDPFDRYLLRHGLLGMDLIARAPIAGNGFTETRDLYGIDQASEWRTPGLLKRFRLHLELQVRAGMELRCVDERGRGFALALQADRVSLLSSDAKWASVALAPIRNLDPDRLVSVDLNYYGSRWCLLVDDELVGSGEQMRERAYSKISVQATSCRIATCRLDYLENPARASATLVLPADVTLPPPNHPDWWPGRQEQLARKVSLAIEDMPLKEAVTVIAKVAAIDLQLDQSAELLQELPVTLTVEEMPVADVLGWLERYAEVGYELTADGVKLVWQ